VRIFSNAGPLMALGKLGQVELLFRLFGQVRLPAAVHREVVLQGLQQGRPDAYLVQRAIQRGLLVVEKEIAGLPADIASLPLDAGEKETIYLALSEPGSLVLLDDLKAREEAKARGLTVKGTLGVIAQAYQAELVSLEEVEVLFKAITADDSIWISDALCRRVLDRLKAGGRQDG